MVQSYTKTPRFGDPKKFQEELDATILKVQKLESELYAKSKKLSEVSGIAKSQNHSGVYWAHNDSGDGANIYAMDESGNIRGT